MTPLFIAFTAASASGPIQSSANPIVRLRTPAIAPATGWSESLGVRSFGRPKCDSRITLPPLSAISVMVGAARSSRVRSLTLPSSIGTLKSTRSSTRLPLRSASSSVRNAATAESAQSDELAHGDGRIGHAVGEAPLVVIPGHHPHQRAVHDFGLVHVEDR